MSKLWLVTVEVECVFGPDEPVMFLDFVVRADDEKAARAALVAEVQAIRWSAEDESPRPIIWPGDPRSRDAADAQIAELLNPAELAELSDGPRHAVPEDALTGTILGATEVEQADVVIELPNWRPLDAPWYPSNEAPEWYRQIVGPLAQAMEESERRWR